MTREDEIIAMYAEDLGESDKLVLALISNEGKIMRTRLHKSALSYCRSFESNAVDHFAYSFGGYSEDVDESLDTLEDIGAISERDGRYYLLEYGKVLIEYFKKEDTEFETKDKNAAMLTSALSKVSDRCLVGLTYHLYPDTTKESTIKESVNIMNERMSVNGKPLSEFTKGAYENAIKKGISIIAQEGR